jgi:hypothetical protein
MTPLAGLNESLRSASGAYAQPDATRSLAGLAGYSSPPTTRRRLPPSAGEEEAQWVHTEQKLIP